MDDVRAVFLGAIRGLLGYAPITVEPGRMTRFPTSERRGDDAGWCLLFVDKRAGVFGDHRTGVSTTWISDSGRGLTPFQRAEAARAVRDAWQARLADRQAKWMRQAASNDRLWSEALPVERNDPVALYLVRRGIDLWPLPTCLRLHRGLPYFYQGESIGTFAVMLAPLVTIDGRMVGLHRTYLSTDGRKAPVPTAKKLTPANGPLAGAAIPLGRPKAGVMGVAEGIETALAARCITKVPVAAAYCASQVAAWAWPTGTRRIVVFGDNDPAGRDAAVRLKLRAAAAQIDAEIMMPSTPGDDWNDVLRASQEAAP